MIREKVIVIVKIYSILLKFFAQFVFLWILFFAFSQVRMTLFGNTDLTNLLETGDPQGMGFSLMNQALPMWKILRNMGYILSLPLLVIEVAVYAMMDKKLPLRAEFRQAVITQTIQSVLLLTFSYALAGLAIDMLYIAYFMNESMK